MEKRNVNTNLVAALLVVIAVLGYGVIGKAGNLEPSAAPAPTMKTLDEVEPRIPISQADIPKTISTRGSYYLTEDITAAGTAITVAVDDVTIDLMGYTLKGPDSGIVGNYGISMHGRSNVEIRNGTVRDFNIGIIEGNDITGQNHRVINVRAVSNLTRGIFLYGKSHLVKDCTASDNGILAIGFVWGIFADSGSTVTGNTAYDNGTEHSGFPPNSNVCGIQAWTGSTVTGNTSYNNGYSADSNVYGIKAGSGSTMTGNTVYNNGTTATGSIFGISTGSGTTVTGNTVNSNSGDGIVVDNGCIVSRNTVYDSNDVGISVGTSCTVKENTVFANNGNGINAGANSTIIGNTVRGNQQAGIYNGWYCVIKNNTANLNTYNGISTGPGCMVSGNATYGNGWGGIWVGEASTVVSNTAYQNQRTGIYLKGNSLVDQNTAYDNNQSGGGFVNMYDEGSNCTITAANHAP